MTKDTIITIKVRTTSKGAELYYKNGGEDHVYNLNGGTLLEPLFLSQLSNYFNENVDFVDKCGYDYITKSGIKIEHKGMVITDSSNTTIKNFGESKNQANYLSILNVNQNKLFIINMKFAKDNFITCYDKTNNKVSVSFCNDLNINSPRKHKKSNSFKNTKLLLEHGIQII